MIKVSILNTLISTVLYFAIMTKLSQVKTTISGPVQL